MEHFGDIYQRTLQFAARAHGDQKVPDQPFSYVVHLASVAQEIMALELHTIPSPGVTLQVALLHDILEDTTTSAAELEAFAGPEISLAVQALTKNAGLPKDQRMPDSLRRIRQAGQVARMVKMTDRIVNLQTPPVSWPLEKVRTYLEEARTIFAALSGDHPALDTRFQQKLQAYEAGLKLRDGAKNDVY